MVKAALAIAVKSDYLWEPHPVVLDQKIRKTMRRLLLLLLFASVTIGACKKGPVFGTNNPTFNLDKFEQNIINAYTGHCVGFAYCINQNGQLVRSGAHGLARTAADGGEVPMTIDTRITIASITKFITALGVARAVYDRANTDFFDKIGPFLPSSFQPTAKFADITLEELLIHRSGIKKAPGDGIGDQSFDNLKQLAASFNSSDKTYAYCNKNFSLFRLILPNLLPGVPWTPGLSEEEAYAQVYKTYIDDYVLSKAGIQSPSVVWRPGYASLYPYPYNNEHGGGRQDWTLYCGAGGYYLSAKELAALMAYTWFSDEIASKDERDNIFHKTNLYGLSESRNGDHGLYLIKGGGLGYGNHAFVAHYPNGVQLAIVNTGNDFSAGEAISMIQTLFDDAWE